MNANKQKTSRVVHWPTLEGRWNQPRQTPGEVAAQRQRMMRADQSVWRASNERQTGSAHGRHDTGS